MSKQQVSIFMGGTGANTASDARTNLGVVARSGDTMTGNLNVAATLITQNVIPNANITYDLGSSEARFKDLWLSNSTIYLGEASISAQGGNVSFGNAEIQLSNVTTKLNVTNDLFVSGNVGIGTANPTLSSGKGLHLYSDSGHSNLKLQSLGGAWELLSTTAGYFSIFDTIDANDRFSVSNTGKVGIGTTNPQDSIHIAYTGSPSTFKMDTQWMPVYYGTDNEIGQLSVNRVPTTGVIANSSHTAIYIDLVANTNNSYFSVSTGTSPNGQPTEKFRITGDGNVSIGTTVPSQKLHVSGNTYISGDMGIGTNSPATKLEVVGAATTGTVETASVFRIGRPLTGGVSFDQYADFKIGRYANAGGVYESFTRLDVDLRDNSTSGSGQVKVMTLTNAGYVGIGTTNPTRNLHVFGTGPILGLNSTSTGSTSYIAFQNSGANDAYIGIENSSGGGLFGSNDAYGMSLGTVGARGVNFSTNNIVRSRIDSSGRLLVSSFGAQPRFHVERAGNQTGYNSTTTGDSVVLYNSAIDNIGSHFNTSTGKFTAPVTGMYAFQASAYTTGTAFTQCWLVKNGSRGFYTDCVYQNGASSGIIVGTWIIYLAANDSIGFHPYNPTDSSQTIEANVYHTWFKGYLLG
jgi:hypothetical protein